MTTTATDPDPYVTCDQFCGAKITQTGEHGAQQHFEGCGATADDLRKLDETLAGKRIAATAAREAASAELDEAIPADAAKPVVDPAPAATFRCSCGEVFTDWPPLGDHQTATGHVGMWTEENDALDDDALQERERTTVDGREAHINHDRPSGKKIGEKVDYAHLWPEPAIDLQWLFDAQRAHDERQMKVKGAAASAACPGKATVEVDGARIEISCPHIPILVEVQSYECNREHTHQEVIESLCMIHHVLKHGGKKSVAGLGPLFPVNA